MIGDADFPCVRNAARSLERHQPMSNLSWRIWTLLTVFCLIGCEFRWDSASRGDEDGGREASRSEDRDTSLSGKSGTSAQTGPRGGSLIEIGDDRAYHAEMTLDPATRDIRIYFYSASPGQAKIVSDLVFEIEHAGQLQVLSAEPRPQDGETREATSAFRIPGSSLPQEISAVDQLRGHFHITIDGADYSPRFPRTSSGDVPPHGVDHRLPSPTPGMNSAGSAAITGTITAATPAGSVG